MTEEADGAVGARSSPITPGPRIPAVFRRVVVKKKSSSEEMQFTRS
jgi:hypothetical protein